jgi:hypothetical protein
MGKVARGVVSFLHDLLASIGLDRILEDLAAVTPWPGSGDDDNPRSLLDYV